MHSCRSRQIVTALITVVTVMTMSGLPSLAADPAVFQGRVFQADGVTPLEGVVVRLAGQAGSDVYDSVPTAADGAFRIDIAPAGDYAILARTGQDAFLASESHLLESGRNEPVALTLIPTANIAPAQAKAGPGMWTKVLIAGAIGVGGLFLINEVTEDVEEPASPF
jgi:hypothetical protein